MENAIPKIKSGITSAPVMAVGGAIGMLLLARHLGYHRTFAIIPFTVVGLIIGGAIGSKIK